MKYAIVTRVSFGAKERRSTGDFLNNQTGDKVA